MPKFAASPPDNEAAIRQLCNPASEVSAHYVVLEDGHTLQLVPETRRAWHAGTSSWAGEGDVDVVFDDAESLQQQYASPD